MTTTTADAPLEFLANRFGVVPGAEEGVLHVAAVWRPPGTDRNVVLRICDATPRSQLDFLLLNLARARADAIVTTGRILREEPGVTHDLQGRVEIIEALEQWRRRSLGLALAPWLLVLTGGRDLDPGHPAFNARARPIVFGPESSAPALRRRLEATTVEVVGYAAPSLRSAIAYLRDARGARRISIEAGPSSAVEAYRDPPLIDELLLSVFTEDAIPAEVAGGELPRRGEIERALGPARASFTALEPSGTWRFERYRCAIV